MPVSSSGLVAGKNFPVHPRDLENESHRRKMVRGINQSAAASFTPETQLDTTAAPESLVITPGDDLDLSVVVTPFIPARAHIIFNGYCEFVGTTDVTIEIQQNGATIVQGIASAVAATFMSLTLQALSDLQPDTTYTYTVVATEGGSGDATIAAGATLSVRVEARRLGI
jgi:hypothetical protein